MPESQRPRRAYAPRPLANPSWTARVWSEWRTGNLSRTFRDVLLTLATYRDSDGIAWPSHATLADRVGCSVRHVARALAHAAQKLGLLGWTERRVRAGWRWLRTSNLYRLLMPADPVAPDMRPVWWRPRTTGHFVRGEERDSKKVLLNKMLAEAAGLPDLLAQRRREFETGLWRPTGSTVLLSGAQPISHRG